LPVTDVGQQRIFVSYARRDAAELALRLQKDLTAKGFEVWLDTQRIAGGASWTVEIEEAIERAQVVLALLTQGSYASDICRAEQLRSLRKGKRVIPVLAGSGADVPLHLETKNYRDFSGAKPYAAQLRILLEDIRTGKAGVALRKEFRSTLVTAPPLPRNYVARPEALASLRDAVVTDEPGPSVALTALEGMGGIGKTILAQALSRDEAVQNAFPDGIVWTTVGREPAYDLTTRIQEVRRALGDEPGADESELHSIDRYRTLMRDKAALVIVDDVWRSEDVGPFLAESRRSKILFTTRSRDIAAVTGASTHTAELLTVEQSRALLARWAEYAVEALPHESDGLVRECGRLPLALAMVGAMLRGKPLAYWSRVLTLLRNADLEKIRAQFPEYPHADLLRAIQVSVDELEGVARERYFALAVLLEDMAAAPAVQHTLWNVDEGEALETAERLVGLSLAQRDADGGGIRLHDLQLDYVRAQYADREALALIHGAVRLSAHVIEKDPRQFASQVVGRLLPHRDAPAIEQFLDEIAVGVPRPWIRPLQPALHPPGTPLMRTLEGHSGPVHGVAVTPDGKRAISASQDCALKVWELDTGRALRTMRGHSFYYGVAVTPNGKWVVSASLDKTLKVWDLETGRAMRTLEGHSDIVFAVVVVSDGKRVVSASRDHTLKVWDLDNGRPLRTLEGHFGSVRGVAVTPDGKWAVSASEDKTLKVWDLDTGRTLRTLEGHSADVYGAAVTPDGKQAVSASGDQTLKVWDLESGRALRTLEGHSWYVYGVAVTPDGKRAISASVDQTLKVWDLDTGRAMRTLEGHSGYVYGVAVTPDGQRAVSASGDQTLKVWDLDAGLALGTQEGHSASVSGVAVTADRQRAVSVSWDQTLKVWDLGTGRALRTLKGHFGWVYGVAVTPDAKCAVSASQDKTLKVWDLDTGRILRTLEEHSDRVTAVSLTAGGRRAVSASWDKTLKVWDLDTGRPLCTLEGHSGYVYGVAVTVDGRQAVSGSFDKTLKVWDLDTGRALRTLEGHFGHVYGVAVTPDGKRAISASQDKTLRVWDLDTGRQLCTLEGHSAAVEGVAVTPDGKRALSASDDKTLKVWNLDTGLLVATFYCDGHARCCAFADERRIVAGDAGGRVYILALEE
jgi:WD40 repeat protein